MKIYEGTVGLVGAGTWRAQAGGVTIRSVLEVGEHKLKNIGVTDYLGNYITPGADVRIMVSYPIIGIFTKPYIVAVEVDGEKHKESVAHVILIKVFLYSLALAICTAPFIGIVALGAFYTPDDPSLSETPQQKLVCLSIFCGLVGVNVLVWIGFIRYFIKSCGQLARF